MAHLRGPERARYVAKIFARTAGRYDLMNTVMTAGRHYAWRRMVADMAMVGPPGPALDVATGTGDLALDLARKPLATTVVGLDFVPEMLGIASHKAHQKGLADRVRYLLADAHDLPFPDGHFICATVGFGIRNFSDVPRTLQEMARVVRPGGRVAVLEIVRTGGPSPAGLLFRLYFRYVTPLLGAIVARDRETYTYLPESVQSFSSAEELASVVRGAGLQNVSVRKLALGTVAIVMGQKAR